jgi:hypothetical protein
MDAETLACQRLWKRVIARAFMDLGEPEKLNGFGKYQKRRVIDWFEGRKVMDVICFEEVCLLAGEDCVKIRKKYREIMKDAKKCGGARSLYKKRKVDAVMRNSEAKRKIIK